MSHEEPAENDGAPVDRPPYRLPVPHWLFSLIGHVIAALVGLALGYLILHYWLMPEKFPLPW